jgi:hypothetical protein
MSDDRKIIDATHRFRGVESPEAWEQAQHDGAAALETLKTLRKLPLKDRETIALRLGSRIHGEKLKRDQRATVAKRAGLEAKELYRLVLRYGEDSPEDAYRLRAHG